MRRDHEEDDTAPASGPRPTRRLAIAGLIVGMAMATAFGGIRLAGAQGMGHHGMGAHAAMDPAEMNRHVDAMVDEVMPEGSAEQKARLAGIIRSAHADIGPMHRQLHQAHARAQELLMQPHVDRAALESLRAEQVRQLDAASRRLVQAAADAADMLTPEQRQRLFGHLGQQMH
jgi:Spy/CpxP family protein refolding chaperone